MIIYYSYLQEIISMSSISDKLKEAAGKIGDHTLLNYITQKEQAIERERERKKVAIKKEKTGTNSKSHPHLKKEAPAEKESASAQAVVA